MCWPSNRLPAIFAWLSNDVPAHRVLAAAWLKRGAGAPSGSGIRHARCGSHQGIGEEEPFMAGVMIGIGPHKASHTAVAISGAEEPLGQLRVRASTAGELAGQTHMPVLEPHRRRRAFPPD